MKCKYYKRYVKNDGFPRIVYFVPTKCARNGYIQWCNMTHEWSPGYYSWDYNPNVICVSKYGLQEVCAFEILVMTGYTPEQAAEEYCSKFGDWSKEE